jgi:hypothetical protein
MAVGPSLPHKMPHTAITTTSTKRCFRFRVCRGSDSDSKYEPEVLQDLGERTTEEEELGFHFIDHLTVDRDWEVGDFPVEDDVVRIAAKWSLNPLEIDAHDSRGPGFTGNLP